LLAWDRQRAGSGDTSIITKLRKESLSTGGRLVITAVVLRDQVLTDRRDYEINMGLMHSRYFKFDSMIVQVWSGEERLN
jgi:hypothetical protein